MTRGWFSCHTGELGSPTKTVTYRYDDADWGDLLTEYDGNAITYDQIGNPLTHGDRTYTWCHGRQLATLTENGTTWTNTYNAGGLRTRRTDGTDTYVYVYDGSSLAYMSYNDKVMRFAHAPDGTPLSIVYQDRAYYYVTNLQGDVVGILDSTGQQVVAYSYDAWGNILSTTGPMAVTLGTHNPLRYCGYVYDPETQLYYLQTRYYDPNLGRFLNADAFATTGQGFIGNNMFAYCNNNPVKYVDHTGTEGVLAVILGCAGGAAINLLSSWLVTLILGQKYTWLDAGVAVVSGVVGVFGLWGSAVEGVINAGYSGYVTATNGGSIMEAVGVAAISGVLSAMLPGSLTKGSDKIAKPIIMAADGIFNFPYSLITASISEGFTADNSGGKANNSFGSWPLTEIERKLYERDSYFKRNLGDPTKMGGPAVHNSTTHQYRIVFQDGRKYIM